VTAAPLTPLTPRGEEGRGGKGTGGIGAFSWGRGGGGEVSKKYSQNSIYRLDIARPRPYPGSCNSNVEKEK